MRSMLLLLAAMGAAPTGVAQAEIYRCVQTDGSVRFVGDPSTCETASRQALTREIQHFGEPQEAALPPTETPTAETGASAREIREVLNLR